MKRKRGKIVCDVVVWGGQMLGAILTIICLVWWRRTIKPAIGLFGLGRKNKNCCNDNT